MTRRGRPHPEARGSGRRRTPSRGGPARARRAATPGSSARCRRAGAAHRARHRATPARRAARSPSARSRAPPPRSSSASRRPSARPGGRRPRRRPRTATSSCPRQRVQALVDVSMLRHDVHVLGPHAERVGHHLGADRPVALPLRRRPDPDGDRRRSARCSLSRPRRCPTSAARARSSAVCASVM